MLNNNKKITGSIKKLANILTDTSPRNRNTNNKYAAHNLFSVQFSSVQSLSRVWLFVTPWTTACQASLSITNSQSLLKLMSMESVMPSNHLILCRPLLLLPSVFPSSRVVSNESVLHIRWPKYWNYVGLFCLFFYSETSVQYETCLIIIGLKKCFYFPQLVSWLPTLFHNTRQVPSSVVIIPWYTSKTI